MAVDKIVLSLACFGRIYCSLDAEQAVQVAEKAILVAGPDADEVDLLDAYDDVWAASLLAGTIEERETTPVHPLGFSEHFLNSVSTDEDREHIMLIPDEELPPEPKKPKRYRNPEFVAHKRRNKKKRRKWDKDV